MRGLRGIIVDKPLALTTANPVQFLAFHVISGASLGMIHEQSAIAQSQEKTLKKTTV